MNSKSGLPERLARNVPIDPAALQVQKRNILRSLAMEERDADEYLSGLIDELTETCRSMLQPRATFMVYSRPIFQKDAGTMTLGGQCFDLGKLAISFLKNSEYMAVFAGTCGPAIEAFSKKLIGDNQGLEGYLADLIASEFAEGVAEKAHEEIEKLALENNLSITNRYSPGYCNWPVSDQHKLFSLLQGHTSGIAVTPSSLMTPVKSVSGMVGIGQKVKKMGYKCRYCDDEKCLMRGK